MSSGVSRRRLFSLFARAVKISPGSEAEAGSNPGKPLPPPVDRVAIIQGRYCLAYTSFCTVCSEQCPVPGAIAVERGIPMVVASACTGCNICHEVCPAPTNAVLMIPRRGPPAPDPSQIA